MKREALELCKTQIMASATFRACGVAVEAGLSIQAEVEDCAEDLLVKNCAK